MNNTYDSVIITHIVVLSIVLLVGIIGLGVLSILIIRWAKRDNWEKGLTVFCLALCLTGIVVGIFCAGDLPPMIKDVRERSYVSYTGEWETSPGKGIRDCNTLRDDSGVTVYSVGGQIPDGIHCGTIVYGKHSHLVVAADLSD